MGSAISKVVVGAPVYTNGGINIPIFVDNYNLFIDRGFEYKKNALTEAINAAARGSYPNADLGASGSFGVGLFGVKGAILQNYLTGEGKTKVSITLFGVGGEIETEIDKYNQTKRVKGFGGASLIAAIKADVFGVSFGVDATAKLGFFYDTKKVGHLVLISRLNLMRF